MPSPLHCFSGVAWCFIEHDVIPRGDIKIHQCCKHSSAGGESVSIFSRPIVCSWLHTSILSVGRFAHRPLLIALYWTVGNLLEAIKKEFAKFVTANVDMVTEAGLITFKFMRELNVFLLAHPPALLSTCVQVHVTKRDMRKCLKDSTLHQPQQCLLPKINTRIY